MVAMGAVHKGGWLAKGENGWHAYRDDPRGAAEPEAAPDEPAEQPVVVKQETDSITKKNIAAETQPADEPVVVKPRKGKTTNQPVSAIGEQTGKQP
jgi:hypothetical protein